VRGGILAVAFELNALLPQTAEKASNRTAQPRSSAGSVASCSERAYQTRVGAEQREASDFDLPT
jgi:hypothetical protein